MGLFASLPPYLPIYLSAISPCTVSLKPLAALRLSLDEQTGASCSASPPASSCSQIGTNCSNNNTRGGQAGHSDGPEDQERPTSQSRHNSVGTVCREMGEKVPAAVQQKEKTSEQKLPQEEKEGAAYERKKAQL